MGIKRYIANADTTITNAYEQSFTRRAYYANMGGSDVLEVFSIFGQVTDASIENSRILIKFPVDNIISNREQGIVPNSGSVNFFIKLSNVRHSLSLPSNYDLLIVPVSSSWEEGTGLDMESYLDKGATITEGIGTNWKYKSLDAPWATDGGDFIYSLSKTFHINNGDEDILLDVTDIIEKQISGQIENNGFGIMLSGSYESMPASSSYYTKRFSARNSQYFYNRPYLEARWESTVKDDRGDFYSYSNLLDDEDNKYNLYFYNKIKGRNKNIANNPDVTVRFFTDVLKTQEVFPTYISMSNPGAGIYKTCVTIDTSASYLYDFWVDSVNTESVYFSSSFDIKNILGYESDDDQDYVFKIKNLKDKYTNSENVRFKIFSRKKNWNPTIYNVANNDIENSIHKNLYYRIYRSADNYNVIDYSTGSLKHSITSYDLNGNYFDLDMSIFQPDYSYIIKLGLYENNSIKECSEVFKFRIE